MIHLGFRDTDGPHLDSKIVIEDNLKQSHVSYTLFGLPGFMENIGKEFFPIKKGCVKGLLRKNIKTAYIACKDIGAFLAIAFENPNKYINKEMDLIADLVSGEEFANLLTKIKGYSFKYKSPPKIILRIFAKEFYSMKLFYEKLGTALYVSILESIMRECREIYPDIMTLEKSLSHKLS